VSFLHVILSRLQEESKAKEDTAMETAMMSVVGRILSQEMKSTSLYENDG